MERFTMPESTVLVVSRDASMVGRLGREVERINDLRIDATDDVELACVHAERDRVGLIVVHLAGEVGLSEVARLLWVSSTLKRPVPVLAMSDRYHTDRAVTLFQLGVADYLSRTHHRNRVREVIDTLALRPLERTVESSRGRSRMLTAVS
jgi:DNA-binding response OmpR family regulator